MEDDFTHGFGIVAMLLLGVLVLVGIFLPLLSIVSDVYTDAAYDSACQTFIKQNILGNKFFESKDDNFPCKTQHVTIDSVENYDILKDVTHSMLKCGNTFQMGTSDLFSGKENTPQTFCAACYYVNFTKPDVIISSTEYTKFIFSQKPDKSSQTIAQKLMPKGMKVSQKDFEELQKQLPTTLAQSSSIQFLNTSEQYSIIFRYEKIEGEDQIKDFTKRFGIGGLIGGVVIGTVAVVITVASGGTALAVIVPAISAAATYGSLGAVAGAGLGAWTFDPDSNLPVLQRSEVLFVPFTPESLQTLECDNIIGIQEPGITHKGYTP